MPRADLPFLLAILAAAAGAAVPLVAAGTGVWPPPRSISLAGPPAALGPGFRAAVQLSPLAASQQPTSARLERTVARFNALVSPATAAAYEARAVGAAAAAAAGRHVLLRLEVTVADLSESLHAATDYSYTLTVDPGDSCVAVVAQSIYGAAYGLESFVQLMDAERSMLSASSVKVVDAPAHAWRGLLVDSGRRFAPVPLLENIIDTMAAVKLNVLHLHVTDFCRFGVQSLKFPNLTAGLASGPDAGFYSQAEIKALIAYGGDRGVRIVPEFEMPGHALGYLPVASEGGLEFCSKCAYGPTGNGTHNTCRPSQLRGSAGTARVLKAVLGEMAELFTDEVLHIGADETFVKEGKGEVCTANSTASLEKQVVEAVARDFKKVPAGWEQVLFETGAATDDTIVYAYMSGASRVTATGHKTVVANGSSLYFTVAAPGGPAGWDKLWYDIGFDVPPSERALLLGGEMSMWTDTYCSPRECGAMPAYHTEKGGALYTRSQDAAYGRSLGGMLWPRGYVGAAAFWNFNQTADAHSAEFQASIWALNDALAARGCVARDFSVTPLLLCLASFQPVS